MMVPYIDKKKRNVEVAISPTIDPVFSELQDSFEN